MWGLIIIHHCKDPVFKQPVMMESRSVFFYGSCLEDETSFLGQKGLCSGAIVGFGECRQHPVVESNLPIQKQKNIFRFRLGDGFWGDGARALDVDFLSLHLGKMSENTPTSTTYLHSKKKSGSTKQGL